MFKVILYNETFDMKITKKKISAFSWYSLKHKIITHLEFPLMVSDAGAYMPSLEKITVPLFCPF